MGKDTRRGWRTSSGLRTGSAIERDVAESLEKDGWEVLKRGWPDLLCYRDGVVRFIEVKRPGSRASSWERLSGPQRRVAGILSSLGLDVEVVRGEDDLTPNPKSWD